jgi:uncharacterized protein YcbK (DUF882 family)
MGKHTGLWATPIVIGLLAMLPAAAVAQRAHEVRPGESFSAIARRHKVDVWDLALENDMEPKSPLRAGQTLRVPQRGTTYVRPGQTLSHIARAHDCSVEALQRLNGLRGSDRVRAGSVIRLPGFQPVEAQAIDRDWGEPQARGWVKLDGRNASAEVEMVDANGKVRLKGLRELGAVMQRHEDGTPKSVHPRLAMLLSKISDHFGGRPIRVISGFREAGGYTQESSRHLQGRAADIQVAGVPHRAVFEFCRSLRQTGCGYYPRSVFVHVDVREQHVQWVDWSEPGGRARYGTLDRPYKRRERARRDRARIGRKVSRPDELPLVVEVVNKQNAIVRVADERPLDQHAVESLAEESLAEEPLAEEPLAEEPLADEASAL